MSRTAVWLYWLLAVALFISHSAQPAHAQFIALGDLPGGNFNSTADAVSADGSTVVGSSSSRYTLEAFRWTARTGIVGLDSLGAPYGHSRAFGVSGDGAVIVGDTKWPAPDVSWASQAFRWTAETGMVGLGFLPGTKWTTAVAASMDGSVIVGYSSTTFGSRHTAFRWTAADGMIELGEKAPGGTSTAYDVSADGTVIVGSIDDEAFRWTPDSGFTLLGADTAAYAISADGSTIVGQFADRGAARWTMEEGWVDLGVPNGLPWSVSGDGSLILTSARSATGGSILWSLDSGLVDVREVLLSQGIGEFENWSSLTAFDVSADGKTIAGRGINPLGQTEAWVATIPEPSTFGLAILATCGVVMFVMCRRRAAKTAASG